MSSQSVLNADPQYVQKIWRLGTDNSLFVKYQKTDGTGTMMLKCLGTVTKFQFVGKYKMEDESHLPVLVFTVAKGNDTFVYVLQESLYTPSDTKGDYNAPDVSKVTNLQKKHSRQGGWVRKLLQSQNYSETDKDTTVGYEEMEASFVKDDAQVEESENTQPASQPESPVLLTKTSFRSTPSTGSTRKKGKKRGKAEREYQSESDESSSSTHDSEDDDEEEVQKARGKYIHTI